MPRRCISALTKAVDTHTMEVVWDGRPRQLRLLDVVPESAFENSGQSPTEFGRHIYAWLRDEVLRDIRDVEIETPNEGLISNSGKLLGHVFVRGENLAVRMVRPGLSPCFEKYGYPKEHAVELGDAERWAMREGLGIWGSPAAERYRELKRWWLLRAGQVERCRHAMSMGEDILDARLNYDDIIKRASVKAQSVIFADVSGVFPLSDGAVLIQLGGAFQPLCAYFPPALRAFAMHLAREHLGERKPNYLYFDCTISLEGEQPQVVVETTHTVLASPPGIPG